MLVARRIVSMLALAGLLATGSSAQAEKAAKPGSAKEIAQDWRYNLEGKESNWRGIAPNDSDKLYVQTGRITGATLEGAWNFYAQKCGYDNKYAENSFGFIGDQSVDGEYAILDIKRDDRRTTTFAFANERFIVSVQLRQATDRDTLYIDITAATR